MGLVGDQGGKRPVGSELSGMAFLKARFEVGRDTEKNGCLWKRGWQSSSESGMGVMCAGEIQAPNLAGAQEPYGRGERENLQSPFGRLWMPGRGYGAWLAGHWGCRKGQSPWEGWRLPAGVLTQPVLFSVSSRADGAEPEAISLTAQSESSELACTCRFEVQRRHHSAARLGL